MMLYSVPDPEVKLEDIATATPVLEHSLPDPPSVKGREREREREILYSGKGYGVYKPLIAGNFQGRKLSRIGRKGKFCGENFRGMLKLVA